VIDFDTKIIYWHSIRAAPGKLAELTSVSWFSD